MPRPLPSRVLISGAGIISPLGRGLAENETSLGEERTAFRPIDLFDVSQLVAKTAGLIDLPSERLYSKISAHQESRVDRGSKMMLLAVREMLREAGLSDLSGIDAVVIGTSAGAMMLGEQYFSRARSSARRIKGQLTLLESYQPQRQMSLLAAEFGWRGPIIIVSNACASGANAIGYGMELIRNGSAKRVLAGGYDAVAELVFAGFDSLKALAPSGIPRPFDAARDGLAMGEGAAAVLLESEEALIERGGTARAEAAGYATATDLHHLTQPDPNGRAAIRTMTEAGKMAGIEPGEIDYLNSHGTGTPFNDVAEASAIATWAGDATPGIAVSSTKSAMGHLLGGAGAVEAVICLMAMNGDWMPASLNIREVDPVVRFDLIRNFRRTPVRTTLTNSFGFGGTNASLVFRSV